jgi:hypothetical protein
MQHQSEGGRWRLADEQFRKSGSRNGHNFEKIAKRQGRVGSSAYGPFVRLEGGEPATDG